MVTQDGVQRQAAVLQAQTLAEEAAPEDKNTISVSHDVLREALIKSVTQATPRLGKLVHAGIVASYKPFCSELADIGQEDQSSDP